MANNSNTKTNMIIILIVFFLEFLAILVLLPTSYLEEQMRKEQMMIATRYDNDETIIWLAEFSQNLNKQIIYDSGLYEVLHHAFIPSNEEKKKSGKLAEMGSKFFTWADERVNTFVDLMYQYFCRIGLFILWLKPFALLCTLFGFSGFYKRRIKQYNFDMVSTIKHTYATKFMMGCFFVIVFGFFLPIPIDPYIVPFLLVVFACSVGTMVANIQKRI